MAEIRSVVPAALQGLVSLLLIIMMSSHNRGDFACNSATFLLLKGCPFFREDYRKFDTFFHGFHTFFYSFVWLGREKIVLLQP